MTTAAGAIRYEVSASLDAFRAAMAQVKASSDETARSLQSSMEGANKAIQASTESTVERAVRKFGEWRNSVKQVDAVIRQALTTGAAGAEEATVAAFEKAEQATMAGITALAAKIPGPYGKAATAAVSIFSDTIVSGLESLKVKTAGLLEDGLFGSGRADAGIENLRANLTGLFADLQRYKSAVTGGSLADPIDFEKAKADADSWAGYVTELFDGVRTALQKLRGTWIEVGEELQKSVNGIMARVEAEKLATDQIGKSAGAAARLRAEHDMLKAAGVSSADELNAKQRALYETTLKEIEGAVGLRDATQQAHDAALERVRTMQQIEAGVRQEIRLEQIAAESYGQSAAALARKRAEAQALYQLERRGQEASPAEREKLDGLYDQRQAAAEQAALRKTIVDTTSSVDAQVSALETQLYTLGMGAGATAAMRFEMQRLMDAQRMGVPITGELMDAIKAQSERLGESAQKLADAQDRMRTFGEVGRTVASGMEDAFGQWIRGTKMNFREMIDDMLKDFARLAFKMAVTQPLFGGGSSGGGALSAIFGQIFGGQRASGGKVSPDRVYEVGEKGRELFVPDVPGTIVPQSSGGGGGGGGAARTSVPSVSVNVTAPPGSTARETGRRTGSDGSLSLDVLIEQIDAAVSQRIADGTSRIGGAMSSTYGLSAAAGAR